MPKHFDSKTAERKWSELWEQDRLYTAPAHFDKERLFTIDTPPPTVSGSLHIGHIYSYTHTDVLARFHRMRGKDVVYPMGWDDNGLPTERRVQNYFHVRCNPKLQYDPKLQLPASDAIDPKSPPREVSRANFIELCLRLTAQDEKAFKDMWRRIGLSVDWGLEYSTIDNRCRAAAQRSFLDLWRNGHVYSIDAPTMWDVDFQTAVAQAEVEDRVVPGTFHRIRFGVENSDETFVIATTRPELLAACVGVTANPGDARYRHLFGRRAITPLFRVPVPIFPSELADPEKGTGILMVCTFGDATDVHWWREQKLNIRQVLGRDGRLIKVDFSEPNWQSLNPDKANEAYAGISGRNVKQARRIIAEMLRDPSTAAAGADAPLASEPAPIQHSVKFFEKGDQPLEFITTRQWFVRVLDKKDRLLEFGDRIQWHPEFMRHRYRVWVENLDFDWAISRQRYFGVPFPLWYATDAENRIDYASPILASEDTLPVDPLDEPPPGRVGDERNQPAGFAAETDVFDTWFTSSLTPQIIARWGEDQVTFNSLFPMDLRPQAHDIIRTWAFYTIVKSCLHENKIPWRNVAISGWILDPDRKKMSKSRGNVVTPMHLLDEYGSDAVRYWSASAQLGSDTSFDVNTLKIGRRLVTKIFNAAKFVLAHEHVSASITYPIDRVFMSRLANLVRYATSNFENYQHQAALAETERFFWTAFTDLFIEMTRARAQGVLGAEAQGSAISALYLGLNVLLRLFAPFLPYITEEIWSWSMAGMTGHSSIHKAPWPDRDFPRIEPYEDDSILDIANNSLFVINKERSQAGVSSAREIRYAVLAASPTTLNTLAKISEDVRLAARVHELSIVQDNEIADPGVEVRDLEFVQIV